ncbi:MAG TPA: NADH-quinone oxidoreductase subunit C, partial [Streptosporangiaceae bacterium]
MSENRPPSGAAPGEAEPDEAALAGQQRLSEQVVRTGMFGTQTTGDTSGYGGLQVRRAPVPSTPRPYGSYFDEIADALSTRLEADGTGFGEAVERVIVDRGELTLHVRREHLIAVAQVLRDEPTLAFELCSGVSGAHYLADLGRELHAVYHLVSITHNRR